MESISIISRNGGETVFFVSETRATVLFSAACIRFFIIGVGIEILSVVWIILGNVSLSAGGENLVDGVVAVFRTAIFAEVVNDSVIVGIVLSSKSPIKSWVCRLNSIWLLRSFTYSSIMEFLDAALDLSSNVWICALRSLKPGFP